MSIKLDITTLFGLKAGKVALITGGSSGLGEMMCTALTQLGCRTIIVARKESRLIEVSERLTREGPGSCEYIVGDVSSKENIIAIVEAVKRKTDTLDILVNNAGVSWGDKWDNFDEVKGWDRVLAVNVKSIFYMSSLLAPLLAKNATSLDPGRIVNIASVAGLDPQAADTGLSAPGLGLWSYNTSKAAAIHLSNQLAVTLGPKFITSNCIAPGVFPSEMTKYGLANAGDKLAASHPMKRIGAAEDIAGHLLFLVSRAGAHVTGSVVANDGGALISGRGYSHL